MVQLCMLVQCAVVRVKFALFNRDVCIEQGWTSVFILELLGVKFPQNSQIPPIMLRNDKLQNFNCQIW